MMKWIAVLLLTLPAFGQSQLGGYPASSSGGSGSQRVVYTSQLLGTTGDATVAAGSSATGLTDRAGALNAALLNGNVRLVVDGQYALGSYLTLYSNTTLECLPGMGFIMLPGANVEIVRNAHLNAPTTVDGNGYDVSNQADSNIAIRGCKLYPNATQAATGTDGGVAHKANPSNSNNLIWGANFAGINNFWFENNELYDSATIALSMSNMSNAHVNDNYIHQPLPTVQGKNTDGVHFYGPSTNLYVARNRVDGGDDTFAFNADDLIRPCENPPASVSTYTYLKWGPITNVWADSNYFDFATAGFRLYSVDSLVDNIHITNSSGATLDEPFNITIPTTGTCTGQGNIGRVYVDGWQVMSNGSQTGAAMNAILYTSANINSLEMGGLQITDPGANWPVILQAKNTIRNLTLRDWQVSTQAQTLPCVVTTNGPINNLSAHGIQWDDNTSHTAATFFCGTVAPTALTLSNYAGPNRVSPANIAPPGTVTPTPSTTGGTLAAGTYYYKVTARNANGETTSSTEVSATTTGTTSSVALSWGAVSGATGYRVYRGTTAGGESVYYSTATNSYTDTNAASTVGSVPTVNSTSGYTVAYKNGDAFSNSYASNLYGTVYMNTTFNEAASGTALNGTTPATCANGCTGTWGAASGYLFAGPGVNHPGALPTSTGTYSVNGQDWAVMNAGVSDAVVRYSVTNTGTTNQLLLRFTDISNTIAIAFNNTTATIYSAVGGTYTNVGSASGNYSQGNFVVTLSGTTVTFALAGQPTITATVPASTATKYGFTEFTSATNAVWNSLQVSSQ